MFNKKFTIINEDWEFIDEYSSTIKPFIGELLYINLKYYKIISIIHTIKRGRNIKLTIVVKEVDY